MTVPGDTAIRVRIRGRVQGVGFRAWAAAEARRNGLTGWVRNRRDGSVEAVFRGDAEAIAAMREACRRGPGGARVDGVTEDTATIDDAATGTFEHKPTV